MGDLEGSIHIRTSCKKLKCHNHAALRIFMLKAKCIRDIESLGRVEEIVTFVRMEYSLKIKTKLDLNL